MMKLFTDDEPHGVFFLIDNKSYASCQAVARGLNPLKVPLVVLSEAENTNGGLILATSPEAKACGVSKNTSGSDLDKPTKEQLKLNDYYQVTPGDTW